MARLAHLGRSGDAIALRTSSYLMPPLPLLSYSFREARSMQLMRFADSGR